MDDKLYEGQLLVPGEGDIAAATNDDDALPGLAFFRAVERLAGPVDTSRNMLQISTSNTDCLACDVPPEQLVGETPCVASNQCAGKTLYDILNLDETPTPLKEFADSVGWGESDKAAGVDLTQPLPEPEPTEFVGVNGEAASNDPVLRLLRQSAADANAPAKLPDVSIVEGEFTVFCKRSADATGESTCGDNYRNARAALSYTLGDLTGESPDFSISAWDKKVVLKAPLFAGLLDLAPVLASLEAAALEAHPDAASSTFGFTVTSKDEAKRRAVGAQLHALAEDASALLTNLDWLDNSATEYVGIRFAHTGKAVLVPGVPLGVKASDLLAGSVAPAVVVKAPNTFGGLHTAAPGEAYEVAVANFPAGNTVDINVIDTGTGRAVANQSTTRIPIKLVKAAGATSIAWMLPEGLEPGKDYLLQASLTNAPAISAQTLPFKIVT